MLKLGFGSLAVAALMALVLAGSLATPDLRSYGGGGWMMGPGMRGPGWGMMNGWTGTGPGMMYGYEPGYYGQGNLNLTRDQVKTYLQKMIRNPNLTVGDVKEKDGDSITADVVTKQGDQLVQRLDFNRHNGFVQPEL